MHNDVEECFLCAESRRRRRRDDSILPVSSNVMLRARKLPQRVLYSISFGMGYDRWTAFIFGCVDRLYETEWSIVLLENMFPDCFPNDSGDFNLNFVWCFYKPILLFLSQNRAI